MTDYFWEFFDIYFQAVAIMKERSDAGYPNNEGLLFIKTEDAKIDALAVWYILLVTIFIILFYTFIIYRM